MRARNAALDANGNQVELDLRDRRLGLVAQIHNCLELCVVGIVNKRRVVELAAIKPLVIHLHVELVLDAPALAHHVADFVIHLDLDYVHLVATELDPKSVLVVVRVRAIRLHEPSIV